MVGCAQIPLGVAGPIIVNTKKYYLPLAGTEGALVASINRGCKISREAGGINVAVENIGITRGPVFKTKNLKESFAFVEWINKNINKIKSVAESTSHHLKLLNIENQVVGKNVFLRFIFDSSDAMGMNMATIAVSCVADMIKQKYEKVELVSLSGNFCVDKKASWLNFVRGRGKKVWADIIVNKKIVFEILHVAPEKIAEVCYHKNLIGSAISGSTGFNSHFANIVAAIFLATGQDAAHVVEGSLGITTAEVEENGDLYFSVYLPDVVCGTVGGGTNLATQKEALKIMNVQSANEFAEVLGGAVLAGELSLLGSLAENSLASAHAKLGRGK
jgi:hydroxymethylglutaryl-CoA reductase (NADPH)